MKVAIRYQSRGGNVRAMAEAMARAIGVEAVSIDEPGAQITEHIDLLFIGGALYKFQLDPQFREYLDNLPEGLIDEAVCFGSSMLTRRPIYIMQDRLKAKGIKLNKQAVYSRNRPNDSLIEAIEYFAKNEVTRDRSLDGLPPYMIFKRSQEIKAAKEAAAAAGVEYVPDGEYEVKLSMKEAEEAQVAADEAQRLAQEAQEAARLAAEQAAEAAALAAQKAEAAAAAAKEAEAARSAKQAAPVEPASHDDQEQDLEPKDQVEA